MKLHDLAPAPGSTKRRTRVGRGIAAGKGKTAGRGTKGQKARAGASIPGWFEGGQTPVHVRVPKLRGFKRRERIEYQVVNVGRISGYAAAGRFGEDEMTMATVGLMQEFPNRARRRAEAAIARAEVGIAQVGVVTAQREAAIKDAIKWADQEKVRIVIAGIRKPGSALADLKAKNIPVILPPTQALPLEEDDPYDQAFSLPAEVYKAGVKFAFGTFGNQFSRNIP